MPDMMPPQLRKGKHVTYWLRCLKTYLPHHYTSMDPNRMSLAFFIVSALDLLDALDSHTNPQERQGYVDWIYSCQHPDGGFRGFPGTNFGSRSSLENAVWDPANLPATYFAIGMLLIFRDDLTRLKREACLTWISRLQRSDGSFGQTIGPSDSIEGGNDTRFGYVAMCIRWFLGDLKVFDKAKQQDSSVAKLSQRISQLQVCLSEN
jgi:geranylgeranyl transferase type-1 subunit beta